MSEDLDEEDTKKVEAVPYWIRNELDRSSVSSLELARGVVTGVQVAVHYDVACSHEALDAINM